MTEEEKDNLMAEHFTAKFMSNNQKEIWKLVEKISNACNGKEMKIGLAAMTLAKCKVLHSAEMQASKKFSHALNDFTKALEKMVLEVDVSTAMKETKKSKENKK